jgi:hypothetical protein
MGILLVAMAAAGNIYVAGNTTVYLGQDGGSNAGQTDIFVHKYAANDPFGDPVWKMQIGTTSYDEAKDIVVDSSGNDYIAALTHGDLYEPKTGRWDLVLVKYDTNQDPNLGLVWFHQYGDVPSNDYIPVSMTLDASESFIYIVGKQDNGSHQMYKYTNDALGTPVYEHSGVSGGYFNDIKVDASGNIYTASHTSWDGGDAYLKKLDTNAVLQWTKTLAGAAGASDFGSGVVLDEANSFVFLTGHTNGEIDSDGSPLNQGSYDAFIAKYDLNDPGNDPLWVEQYGTSGWEQSAKIMMGSTLIKYIAGDTAGELMLMKAAECNSQGL